MKTIERPQIIISSALFILITIILLMLATTACIRERIEGNYDLQTEERNIQSFSKVESKGSFRVEIVPDDNTRVEVRAESNIIPYVETWSDGSTLTVKFRQGYNIKEHYDVVVYLYTPVMNDIRLSGSGRITSGPFTNQNAGVNISGSGSIDCEFITDNFDAVISGSGDLNITGTAVNSELRISGSGSIDAFDMIQKNCNAKISGSGNIKTNVTDRLNVDISGSGSVYYLGDPVVNAHISGSGRVIRY